MRENEITVKEERARNRKKWELNEARDESKC